MNIYYLTIFSTYITSMLAMTLGKKQVSYKIDNETIYKKNNFFVFLTTFILTMVSGLRWRVGTDYWQYAMNYTKYVNQQWSTISIFEEPGIKIISKISSFIYNDYSTMFFIFSLLTVFLFVNTISKNSKMFTFSILLYILTSAWSGSFNGIRQYLACAIIFAGHRYIIERKFLKYLLIIFIASLFHISALSMIILYFVPQIKLNFKEVLLIMIFSIIFIYLYDYIFSLIGVYKDTVLNTNEYVLKEVSFLRVAVSFAPIILYFLVTNKKKLNKSDMFYINILFINAAINLATSNSAYLARFTIYTNVYSILAFPRLLNLKDKKLVLFIKVLIVVFYLIFWYIEISNSSSLSNFQWIFNRH